MRIPPIDFRKLLGILKSEGRAELSATLGARLGSLQILREWNNILSVLEKEVVPLLSKGCEAKALIAPAKKMAKSAKGLASFATEVLSFVPGPIGIVCSVALAIGCFSIGNIPGGFFELLGCIPGGKVAGKGASKLFGRIEKILIEMIQSNHQLKAIIEISSKQQKVVLEFFEKYGPKTKPKAKPEIGHDYGIKTSANPANSGRMPPLDNAIRTNMEREARTHIPRNKPNYSPNNYYNPESTNSMIYRLGTQTGKRPL